MLCILSAVPLFIAVCLNGPDLLYVGAVCLLLVLAGVGSAVFVYGGVYWAAMDRLLEEGDYVRRASGRTRCRRGQQHLLAHVTAAYLLLDIRPVVGTRSQDNTDPLGGRGGVLLRRSHGAS